jgi:hypothetical protein
MSDTNDTNGRRQQQPRDFELDRVSSRILAAGLNVTVVQVWTGRNANLFVRPLARDQALQGLRQQIADALRTEPDVRTFALKLRRAAKAREQLARLEAELAAVRHRRAGDEADPDLLTNPVELGHRVSEADARAAKLRSDIDHLKAGLEVLASQAAHARTEAERRLRSAAWDAWRAHTPERMEFLRRWHTAALEQLAEANDRLLTHLAVIDHATDILKATDCPAEATADLLDELAAEATPAREPAAAAEPVPAAG